MQRWFQEIYRNRELLWTLVYRDIRGRTRASVLGYAWVVLQPLLATGLFTLLIQRVLKINPSGDIPYPVFVFAGMCIWNYFSTSLTMATEGLVTHGDLLRQVNFAREVLVLHTLLGKLLDFVVSYAVLAVMCLAYGIALTPTFLLAPVILVPVFLFCYGVALIMAPLNVVIRDVGKVVPVFLSFAIYLAPVLYPLASVPERWRALYLLNPTAGGVYAFRDLAIGGRMPDPAAVGLAWIVALLVWIAGQWIFDRFEQALSDVV
jgi:lipopolysaccharide transport system permease protein